MIAKLKEMQPSWSVNAPAMVIAKAYLEDAHYIPDTMAFFTKERERVFAKLRALGFTPLDTQANFYLLPVEDDGKLIAFMLSRGIVVRHTRNFMGLEGRYVRIAIKSEEKTRFYLQPWQNGEKP